MQYQFDQLISCYMFVIYIQEVIKTHEKLNVKHIFVTIQTDELITNTN